MDEDQRESLVPRSSSPDLFSDPHRLSASLAIPMDPVPSAHPRQSYQRAASYNSAALPEEADSNYHHSASSSTAGLDARRNVASYQKSTTAYAPRRPHYLLNWWQELAASVMAVAALLALFATVFVFRNKPSPDWPNWLSLNTIVAIYVVLLKSGVLLVTAEGLSQLKWSYFTKDRPLIDLVKYDDASRGPVGAVSLLWTLRTRHLLSSLGALITILALAADPFAQQIVHYHECLVAAQDKEASLPRTNYYVEAGVRSFDHGEESILPGVQSAINAGIFGPGIPPRFDCATGNCTWPAQFSTVGWCSTCHDVTAELSIKNHSYIQHIGNYSSQGYKQVTSLPRDRLSVGVANDTAIIPYAAMGAPVSEYPSSNNYTASIDFIYAKQIGRVWDPATGEPVRGCENAEGHKTWKCKGYGASHCELKPCVRAYNASVDAGNLKETLVDSSSNWAYATTVGAFSMLDTKCINADERRSLQRLGYSLKTDERWLAYSVQFTVPLDGKFNNTFPESMALRNCIYFMDEAFMQSIAGDFLTTLRGTVKGEVPTYGNTVGEFTGPQIAQALFNFGNVSPERISESFANVTDSLTNYLRQNGVANFNAPATGMVYQEKSCIGIQWPWLTFPAFLVLVTLIFFAFTALETRPTGIRPDIWKSSPLALMYHGFAWEDGIAPDLKAAGSANELDRLHAIAKTTSVRLGISLDSTARRRLVEN